jgi:hypothetical protein
MPPVPNFKWDAKQGRYRQNGRFFAANKAMAAVDAFLTAQGKDVGGELFQALREGRLSLKDAQLVGERAIARAHLTAAMAAKGGKAQMSQSDYGRAGGIVGGELNHWRDRFKSLENGAPLDGRVASAFRAYFAAAANTYWRVEDLEMEKRGFDQEENVLDDGAHHCEAKGVVPSCPQVTRNGRYPVGKMPRRGERACRWGCRCRKRRINSVTGEVRQ